MRLEVGTVAPVFTVSAVSGKQISLAALRGRTVLLKFYRVATCRRCKLHMHRFISEYRALDALGLTTVALYHSPAETLRASQREVMPFDLVPDPDKTIFSAYGVETGNPADFFVDADGRIAFAHYGTHHADSLGVAEIAEIRRSIEIYSPTITGGFHVTATGFRRS